MKHWKDERAVQTGGVATKPPNVHLLDRMITNLLNSKGENRALANLNQLQISVFDFTIHDPTSHESIEKLNISATYNRLKREIFPLDCPYILGEGDEWGHPYTDWRNLMS